MVINVTDRYREIIGNSNIRGVRAGDSQLNGPNIISDSQSRLLNSKLNIVKIPRISDSEYDSIKYLVELTGCHWRERFGGFVSYEDCESIRKKLNTISRMNKVELSKTRQFQIENQFYPTPSNLAIRMVNIAEIESEDKVLEPSAGRGAILQYIVKHTSHYTAVECNYSNIKYLRHLGYRVNGMKFEKFHDKSIEKERQFHKIVMNPPFIRGIDCIHIRLAYDLLRPGGRLVALMAENNLYYNSKNTIEFRQFIQNKKHKILAIPSMSFKESGTTVDVVMVIIDKE